MSLNTIPLPRVSPVWAAALLALALGGCAVGPNYQRPTAPDVSSFKEAKGWVPAAPADALDRGPWWQLFGDPVLDQLAARVEVSNQNVAAAVASYAQARALVRQQQASLFPTVSLTGGASRSGSNSGSGRAALLTALQPAPRQARPIWRAPRCPPRASWPSITCRCGKPTPRKFCWTTPSQPTSVRWTSRKTATRPAS